ncbi:hypothetical protein KIN20_001767 [Parelaphostrongylus tenuis]|uniref:Uncharacterized protein n=1 Tax=Parelaphostrongylus tenuis TaxID=148309 RepID=A0AAD5LXF9_PARTN|nr:hypothetical protein KIN20_001767 [Parelaphostrongylus tenuis]
MHARITPQSESMSSSQEESAEVRSNKIHGPLSSSGLTDGLGRYLHHWNDTICLAQLRSKFDTAYWSLGLLDTMVLVYLGFSRTQLLYNRLAQRLPSVKSCFQALRQKQLAVKLAGSQPSGLLCVVHSEGKSPGYLHTVDAFRRVWHALRVEIMVETCESIVGNVRMRLRKMEASLRIRYKPFCSLL